MQNLIAFGLSVFPAMLVLCTAVWLLEKTKLADILLEYFENH